MLDFDRWNLNVQPNPRAEPVAPNDQGKPDVSKANRCIIYFLHTFDNILWWELE